MKKTLLITILFSAIILLVACRNQNIESETITEPEEISFGAPYQEIDSNEETNFVYAEEEELLLEQEEYYSVEDDMTDVVESEKSDFIMSLQMNIDFCPEGVIYFPVRVINSTHSHLQMYVKPSEQIEWEGDLHDLIVREEGTIIIGGIGRGSIHLFNFTTSPDQEFWDIKWTINDGDQLYEFSNIDLSPYFETGVIFELLPRGDFNMEPLYASGFRATQFNLFNDTGYGIFNVQIWPGIADHRRGVSLMHGTFNTLSFLEERTFYVFTSRDYYTIDFRIVVSGLVGTSEWEVHDVELPLEGSPLNITIRHEYFVIE